jgi:hypothetical protein
MHNTIEKMRADGRFITHKGSIISAARAGDMIDVQMNSGGLFKKFAGAACDKLYGRNEYRKIR